MAHGTPDWGVTAGAVTTYQMTDLAELAARLGSVVTFDRRGDVVFLEDFQDGLVRWTASSTGTGKEVDLSVAYARSAQYSARLVPGSDSSRDAAIFHSHPKPVDARLGVELSFTRPANIEKVTVFSWLYDGATVHYAWARYVAASSIIQVFVEGGTWQTVLTGVEPQSAATLFHTMKFVWDASTDNWARLIFDDTEVDLSDYALYSTGDSSDPSWTVQITVTGDAGYNQPVYVDDVILTQNEPA